MTGLVAEFASEADLVRAVDALQAEGFADLDAYTPRAVPALDERLARRPSPVPLIILVGGLAGAFGGFGMELYANTVSYPINIGGRPLDSWPAFIPIAFETGVLAAILAGFFGFLIVNRMPALSGLWLPAASRNGYLLAIPGGDATRLKNELTRLGAVAIEEQAA